MNRRSMILAAAVLAAGVGTFGPSAEASCSGPVLEVVGEKDRYRPGDVVHLRGGGWGDLPCNDTGGGATGPSFGACTGDLVTGDFEKKPKRVQPYRGIDIVLSGPITTRIWRRWTNHAVIAPTEHSVFLDDIDANSRYAFDTRFTVPKLPKGRYFLHAGELGSPTWISVGG